MGHPKQSKTAIGTSSKFSSSKPYSSTKREGDSRALVTVSRDRNKDLKPNQFLSPDEMSRRRAAGLCFYCDEKFTPEHYQQHRKKQLFNLQVGYESDSDQSEDEKDTQAVVQIDENTPRISVNAIDGVTGYQTLKVKGNTGKRIVYALLDSGSTHNFIDPKMVEKAGCIVKHMGLHRLRLLMEDRQRFQLRWNSFIGVFRTRKLNGFS